MLLSYWDSGYVLINVDDPSNPSFIADTDFPTEDPLAPGLVPEGNGHEAEFTADHQYVVAADEDFGPYAQTATNDTDGTSFSMTSGSDTPQLGEGETINGLTVYVGRACPGDAAVPAGDGTQIALVERGVCDFTVKQAAVEAAGGYVATITFSREGPDACEAGLTMLIEGTIPAFFVARSVGFDFLDLAYDEAACLAGNGTVTAGAAVGTIGDEVTISSNFDGWGYVRLFATENDFTTEADGERKLTELDHFAIPEAHDPAFASGFGDLSVHEAATSHEADDIVYFAYYSGGFRVLRIVDDQLVEVGAWIDEELPGGNNLWGVQVFEHDGVEYVAASDRDYGLYIFEYTGEGSPNS
jgi:catechol 2,3-dioxygenase-like lactoylglutathione lyase family enzyme